MNHSRSRTALTALVALIVPTIISGSNRKPMPDPQLSAPAYVTSLAAYTFDDGFGGPDPQGWVTVDLTAQRDTFTHVDDFAGMPAPWGALEGARSMWVGVRAENAPCNYVSAPGYGNSWFERIESVPFSISGDVTISYRIAYQTEPSYDFISLDYVSKTGSWRNLETYHGPFFTLERAEEIDSLTVPADSLGTNTRFRFTFSSDGLGSDEDGIYPNPDTDGALILDSLVVTDSTGVVDYQDFESVAVGATSTGDGHWYAGSSEFFGDFAGLFHGSTVLQEDPSDTNNTYLWGFFNDSPDSFGCGGHPEQASVPLGPIGGQTSPKLYISNGVASPVIDLSRDMDGNPVASPPDRIAIGYDVYVDRVPNNLIRYNLAIRFIKNGCSSAQWIPYNPGNTFLNKQWVREQTVATLPNDVAFVQVLLFAQAKASSDAQTCHSHAPLFDNVTIDGWFDTLTDADAPTATGFALRANVPNPFNPVTMVAFDIPEGGAHVRVSVYDVAGRRLATLVDGYRGGGSHEVRWNGTDAAGRPVASGVYFYRLEAPGFDESKKMVLLK